jgi:CrcB protein
VTAVYVVLGAALGATTRYVVGHLLDRRVPWGTVLVNVLGSFALGVLSGLAVSGAPMALLGVGFCGALTTYSAFAVQTVDRGPRIGLLTVVLTIPLALAACALGYWLAHA